MLQNISLKVKRGSKVAVVGRIGSGKSSLLSALVAEMHPLPGTTIKRDRLVAYTSQTAWTITASVKDNILLGKPMDEKRFQEAIEGACLTEDLKILPHGISTIVGNKGVNLSGGQKARLAIARALYSDADLYLFDDPISALDIKVGHTVINTGILGHLHDKTVIMTTHALNYLRYFDIVVVIDAGKIVYQANYDDYATSQYSRSEYVDRSGVNDDDCSGVHVGDGVRVHVGVKCVEDTGRYDIYGRN